MAIFEDLDTAIKNLQLPEGIQENISAAENAINQTTGNWKFTFEVIVAIFGNGIDINVDKIENLLLAIQKGVTHLTEILKPIHTNQEWLENLQLDFEKIPGFVIHITSQIDNWLKTIDTKIQGIVDDLGPLLSLSSKSFSLQLGIKVSDLQFTIKLNLGPSS